MNIKSIPEDNKSSFVKDLLLTTVVASKAYNRSEIIKFLKTILLDRSLSDVSNFYTSDRIVSLIKSKDNSPSGIFETFSILSEGIATLYSHGDISYNIFVTESSSLELIKQACLLHKKNFVRDILIYSKTSSIDNIYNLRKWINVFESSKIDGIDELV